MNSEPDGRALAMQAIVPRLLSLDATAVYLGISPWTVRDLEAGGGKVLRCAVNGISSMGRATQGVRVMNLSSGEKLVSIARLPEEDVANDVGSGSGGGGSETPQDTQSNDTPNETAEPSGDQDSPSTAGDSEATDTPDNPTES